MEHGYFPDLAIGFESQGYGHVINKEYEVYPRGMYLCLGKTLSPTNTYVQITGNYWRRCSGSLAVNQNLLNGLEAILEYDLALTDRRPELNRRGYLNFGLGWTIAEKLRLTAGLLDLLGNRTETRFSRILDLSFRSHF